MSDEEECEFNLDGILGQLEAEERHQTTNTEDQVSGILKAKDVGNSEEEIEEELENPSQPSTSAGKYRRTEFYWLKNKWQPPSAIFVDEGIKTPSLRTPLQYFEEYFNDNVYERILFATNQRNLATEGYLTNIKLEEIKKMVAMLLTMGIINYPRTSMYWGKATKIPLISNSMGRGRFHFIRNVLKFAEKEDNNDKLWKVRFLLDVIRQKCIAISKKENLCVDEMMVPFKGRTFLKMYMPKKPIKWGLKLFVLCSFDGVIHDFEIYQGKGTIAGQSNMGFCSGIVMRLSETIPHFKNYRLYFDNYFTGLDLLIKLKDLGIWATGTIRANRMGKVVLKSEKDLRKVGPGSLDYRIEKGNNIFIMKWLDNGIVQMASTLYGDEYLDVVTRFCQKEKRKIDIQRPNIVKMYNKYMGGVDKMDFLLSLYRISIKARKWTVRFFDHMIDVAVCNAWLEYKRDCEVLKINPKEIMDLLAFRDDISIGVLAQTEIKGSRKRGRPSANLSDLTPDSAPSSPSSALTRDSIPATSTRFDHINHWPVYVSNRTRCKVKDCERTSRYKCEKCNVHLCLPTNEKNCFIFYHNQ